MKPAYLAVDTLDDRRELAGLLAKLKPADRWRFVKWCCSRSRLGKKAPELRFSARDRDNLMRAERFGDERADFAITAAAYGYLFTLSAQWGLDLNDAAGKLVAIVRGKLSWTDLERG